MPTRDVSIARHFADLPDPRVDRAKKHLLGDILVIAVGAVVCGANSREEVEALGDAKEPWLKRFLKRPPGLPSHDTFPRVSARLDPAAFGVCVAAWMEAVCEATGLRHIATDGTAVRSAPRGTFTGCLHVVSGWATESRLILGQQAVADGSHEIAAIPERLRVLGLKGAVVTIDAAGCRKDIARQVRDRGGDYLPAVRGNQPALRAAVEAVLARACAADFAGVDHDEDEAVEDGHGRRGERSVAVVRGPQGLPSEWPGVAAVVFVGREREVGGKGSDAAHHSITSLRGTAAQLGGLVRRPWAVGNELHWCRDVAFREDANKTAAGHAGANLGLVRRVAAALLQRDPG